MANVLFIVAHCDDECISMGGTLAKHVADGDTVQGLILSPDVGSRDGSTEGIPARIAMCDAASKVIGYDVDVRSWPDQQFDTWSQLALNKTIESVVKEFHPDIVYTHWDQDNNLDHRLVSQACQVACRSVGELFMGKPNGYWTNHHFGNSEMRDVSDVLDVKQKALDCYWDELGEVVADPYEGFYQIVWTRGTL